MHKIFQIFIGASLLGIGNLALNTSSAYACWSFLPCPTGTVEIQGGNNDDEIVIENHGIPWQDTKVCNDTPYNIGFNVSGVFERGRSPERRDGTVSQNYCFEITTVGAPTIYFDADTAPGLQASSRMLSRSYYEFFHDRTGSIGINVPF